MPRHALRMQKIVNIQHKGMEMHTAFARQRHLREKQIHDHRFAAPDAAVKVIPLRRRRAFAKQAAAGRCITGQRARESVERRDGFCLHSVRMQIPRRQFLFIGF